MDNVRKLPKKILRITDLTFALPDDFDGDITNAFDVLLQYMQTMPQFTQLHDNDKSTVESLFEDIIRSNESKICMRYGIFECDENGNYNLK